MFIPQSNVFAINLCIIILLQVWVELDTSAVLVPLSLVCVQDMSRVSLGSHVCELFQGDTKHSQYACCLKLQWHVWPFN